MEFIHLDKPLRKGGESMNKMLFILIFTLLAVGFVYGISDATPCATCHTMHNSQGGSAIDTDGANERLLVAQCVECHTGAPASNSSTFGAPKVISTGPPTAWNSGGDFYWATAGSHSLGHNVSDTGAAQDNPIGLTPPGWDPEATNTAPYSATGWGPVNNAEPTWGSQLTCAGVTGCHGEHNSTTSLAAIGGSHHNNETGGLSTADTVGNSYRFLNGIWGYEDPDYNFTEDASTHNEYYGTNDTNAGRDDNAAEADTYTNYRTISFLCAQCHGIFHSRIVVDNASVTSPWVRHPTDIVLPNLDEYSDYNPDNSGEYNVDVPVARGAVPSSSSSSVSPGNEGATGAIVMCLSCHRAHGSSEPDILRFTYDMDTTASGTADTGCFVCHTTKNND